ncbi:MAG: DmsE family decaheme c-type cytochrome [Acidobacteria bacterium]|nr:DmsE family decaheme c-type cytochrome [Acidobacteriota bacterium]
MRINARSAKIFLIAIFAGLLLIFFAQGVSPPALSQSTTPAVPQTEVGKDCKQCHGAIVESFALQTHGKTAKFLTDSRAASCQICHTNSAEHAENSSRTKSGADPGNPAKQTASKANSSCLQCHSQDKHTFAWAGGEHDKNNVSCLSCHSQHHSKSEENMLANFTTEETCLRCHTGVRKSMHQRSTHLFRTEQRNMKVGCTSCHNPHGGDGDKMMVAETVNNTCYGCHAEKRGPFLWEHAPVRENCMSCHSPHGSNNAKLLTARAHMSCQQCHIHMLPRHSTTAGKPLDIWSLNRGCVNCHAQIHGSNHPGGRTLTR